MSLVKLGKKISEQSLISYGYAVHFDQHNEFFMYDDDDENDSTFPLMIDNINDDILHEYDDAYAQMYMMKKNRYDKAIFPAMCSGTWKQVFKLAKTRSLKSYVFTALVGDKFYTSVKNDLITFAKEMINMDATTNWHMKVIVNKNKPFNLINVFITNNTMPQLIHLGAGIVSVIRNLYSPTINNDSEHRQTINKILTRFNDLFYVYEEEDVKEQFRSQLTAYDPNDTYPMLDKIYDLYQKCVKEGNLIYSTETWHSKCIESLDLDVLFKRYKARNLDNCALISFTDTDSTWYSKLKLKSLVNDLVNRIS